MGILYQPLSQSSSFRQSLLRTFTEILLRQLSAAMPLSSKPYSPLMCKGPTIQVRIEVPDDVIRECSDHVRLQASSRRWQLEGAEPDKAGGDAANHRSRLSLDVATAADRHLCVSKAKVSMLGWNQHSKADRTTVAARRSQG